MSPGICPGVARPDHQSIEHTHMEQTPADRGAVVRVLGGLGGAAHGMT